MHNRQSIRLKGYDYSQEGLYFITICTQNRAHLFGEIKNGNMMLYEAGEIAKKCWLEIPLHFPKAILYEFIVMPNHIHGIIEFTVGANNNSPIIDTNNNSPVIDTNNNSPIIDTNNNSSVLGANNDSPLRSPSKTIGSVVRGFKIGVTKWMRQQTSVQIVWQRNYYEHIIRDEKAYFNISNYIKNNPVKWQEDKFYTK